MGLRVAVRLARYQYVSLLLNALRRPPRPGRKQRGPTNCWCQSTAARRRTERLTGGMGDKKQKRSGPGKTGRRRNETRQRRNQSGKQVQKLEFESGQEMKTNGLCFVSRTLGLQHSCRSQPVQARKKQEWRKSGCNKEEKRSERVGEGTAAGKGVWGGGAGDGGGRRTAQIHWRRRDFTAGPWGSFMGSHRRTPPKRGRLQGIKTWGIEGIRKGTSDRFGRGRGE